MTVEDRLEIGSAPAATEGLGGGLRELTGYEEEVLERKGAGGPAAVCNDILARCLTPIGQDHSAMLARVRRLPVADRDRLLARLRQKSLGDVVKSQVRCPQCGSANQVNFRVSQLPLDFASPPPEIQVEVDGIGRAVLRTPLAGDQEHIQADRGCGNAERRTRLLAVLLARLGEQHGPFTEDFTRALPVRVRQQLESALETSLPDFELSMAAQCVECGTAFTSAFDVAGFFLPNSNSGAGGY